MVKSIASVKERPEPFRGVIFQLEDMSWTKLEVKDDVTPKESVHIAVLLTMKTVNMPIEVDDFIKTHGLERHFVPTKNPW